MDDKTIEEMLEKLNEIIFIGKVKVVGGEDLVIVDKKRVVAEIKTLISEEKKNDNIHTP